MMYSMISLAVVCEGMKYGSQTMTKTRKRARDSHPATVGVPDQRGLRHPGLSYGRRSGGSLTRQDNPGGDPHGNPGYTVVEDDGENRRGVANGSYKIERNNKRRKIVEWYEPSCLNPDEYEDQGKFSKGQEIRFYEGGDRTKEMIGKCLGYNQDIHKSKDGKTYLNKDVYLVEYCDSLGIYGRKCPVPSKYLVKKPEPEEKRPFDLPPIQVEEPSTQTTGFWDGARPIEPETPCSPLSFEQSYALRRAKMGEDANTICMRQGVQPADLAVQGSRKPTQ